MKGIYKLEVIKDDKSSGIKKAQIIECYGWHWIVDFHERSEKDLDDDKFVDLLFFLIWLPDKGWFWVERCHFKPVDAILNKLGIC